MARRVCAPVACWLAPRIHIHAHVRPASWPRYEFSIKPRISTENRFGPRVWGGQFNEIRGGRAARAYSVFASTVGPLPIEIDTHTYTVCTRGGPAIHHSEPRFNSTNCSVSAEIPSPIDPGREQILAFSFNHFEIPPPLYGEGLGTLGNS